MAEPSHLGSATDTPIYTIKTVVQQTGITPATLRAWERRYGVLSPGRSDGGYRLYSERDIAILRWLKAQVEAGIAISSAVTLLELQHRAGEQPEQDILSASPAGREPAAGPRNAPAVIEELLGALLVFHEGEAEAILAEAFALYPVESVAEDIIAPVLVEIGERWHRGEATVVQEHFATAFLRRRLSTLFHAYDQPAAGPLAITGSAPGEWHDVGILLVSLTLRRHGWRVIYLGQNVPVSHLIQEAKSLVPDLVCVSATTADSVGGLVELSHTIDVLPHPKPRLVLGGRILNTHEELRARFPHATIAASARELIAFLGQL
jgi:MerR family transcriptional regulator, light-induced transcriptional regulator